MWYNINGFNIFIGIILVFNITKTYASDYDDHIIDAVIVFEPLYGNVVPGENFTISCEIYIESEFTTCNVEWNHLNKIIMQRENRWHQINKYYEDDYFILSNLTIYQSKTADTGKYECSTKCGENESSSSTNIDVIDLPYVSALSKTAHAYEGNNLTLSCRILWNRTYIEPQLKIEWIHQYKHIIQAENRWHESNEIEKEGYILAILKVYNSKMNDSGKYECTGINGEIYRSSVTNVTIIDSLIVKAFSINQYVIEGNQFTITCGALYDSRITSLETEWSHHNKLEIQTEGRWFETNQANQYNDITNLTILRSQISDSGEYKCKGFTEYKENYDTINIKILGADESYSYFDQNLNQHIIDEKCGHDIKLIFEYEPHLNNEIEWNMPNNTKITLKHKNKFIIDSTETKSILNIKNSQVTDSGIYSAMLANTSKNETNYKVLIRSKPIVNLATSNTYSDKINHLECLVYGYPETNISWIFVPCICCNAEDWSLKCINSNASIITDDLLISTDDSYSLIEHRSIMPIFYQNLGKLICSAKNTFGETFDSLQILPQPLLIPNPNNGNKILVGNKFTLNCMLSPSFKFLSINWFKNKRAIKNATNLEIIKKKYVTSLVFKNIEHKNNGSYECVAVDSQNKTFSSYAVINVQDPTIPNLSNDSIKDDTIIYKDLGESIELRCIVTEGFPIPTIEWFKNNNPIIENDNMYLNNDNSTLTINAFRRKDNNSVYKCIVSNVLWTIERSVKIKIADGIHVAWIAGIIFLGLLSMIFIILFCIREYKNNQIRKQLTNIGVPYFEEGFVEQINLSMTLNEQAELLPYNKSKFEFPKEKINLGKLIGQGAFGVVHKAVCSGIIADEKESIVAVKMVKKTADNETIKALASELKIMTHLGQHPNVISLLGAVTKNIFKRELMIIIEFCKFGNVRNYLLKNRQNFTNQIDPETDKIDLSIVRMDDNFPIYYNCERLNLLQTNARHSDLPVSSNTDESLENSTVEAQYNYSSSYDRKKHRKSFESQIENNSLQITTSHLISWAFQVARGMDYLTSYNVLHGDLAARNILLCEDNIVKICDFGLAHTLYRTENYQKRKQGNPLPIKWLALETLEAGIFSKKSDIWSYGIMLWEFFSLSKIPYPGIKTDNLYEKIKNGYRMEKPIYANQELYEIMLKCWNVSPDTRPNFNDLEKYFKAMLEDEEINNYLPNDIRQEKHDYINCIPLMEPPEENAPAVPLLNSEAYNQENRNSNRKMSKLIDLDSCHKNDNPKLFLRTHSDDYIAEVESQIVLPKYTAQNKNKLKTISIDRNSLKEEMSILFFKSNTS